MPLHANYKSNLADAQEFEDFVFDTMLHERKLVVGGYRSRHYQVAHGESATGVEVKFDREFRNTGNLFVETMERANVNEQMLPSGIYHPTNPWLRALGDDSPFWVFATQTLRNIHEQAICREAENRTHTGRGFLLPVCKADRHMAWKWEENHGR
jgi:hypothetical protein